MSRNEFRVRGSRILAPLLFALALSALIAPLAAPAALAAANCRQTSLPEIEDEVMCPICGVPLVNAGGQQAENERDYIRGLVDQCKSEEQIKAALVSEYGEEVLAVPSKDGFGLAAYIVPIAGFALAAAALAIGAVRWRRGRGDFAVEDDAATLEESAADIDADLQRYDL